MNELVYINGSGSEKRINWELASLPEFKRLRAVSKSVAPQDKPPFVVEVQGKDNVTTVTHQTAQSLLELPSRRREKGIQRPALQRLG